MKLAIMQPTFMPWIGYFELIDNVDKFIFLDTVQLNQQSWQTRNKLKVKEKEYLFSLPIQKTHSKQELFIKDALLDFRKYDFRKKLFKTLTHNYKKSDFYHEVHDFIKSIIFYETPFLSDYNINIITQISQKIGIQTEINLLSKTDFPQTSKKGNLVLDVCRYFHTTQYFSPLNAKNYLTPLEKTFHDEDVEIIYQNYKHPIYNQLGESFTPYMGIFDLLYNEGFENSLKIIRSGREYENRQF